MRDVSRHGGIASLETSLEQSQQKRAALGPGDLAVAVRNCAETKTWNGSAIPRNAEPLWSDHERKDKRATLSR
jgi:hypothetical protein